MGKRRTFQFSLSTLFVAVTGFALLLAVAHWRRSAISRDNQDLAALGFKLLWTDSSPDAFWPTIPEEAAFEFKYLSPEEVEIASARYTIREANAYCEPIFDRLNRLGVDYVLLVEDGKNTNTSVSTIVPTRGRRER